MSLLEPPPALAVEDIPSNGASIYLRQQDHQIGGGEGRQLLFLNAHSLITMRARSSRADRTASQSARPHPMVSLRVSLYDRNIA